MSTVETSVDFHFQFKRILSLLKQKIIMYLNGNVHQFWLHDFADESLSIKSFTFTDIAINHQSNEKTKKKTEYLNATPMYSSTNGISFHDSIHFQ